MDRVDETVTSRNTNELYDYIEVENVSFEEFYANNLSKNRPCLIAKSATRDWDSRRNWVSDDGKPNFAYLKKMFGDERVPVADCKVKHYDAQLKTEMKFADYLDYWEDYISKGYPKNLDCLYLKDWHFPRKFPDYSAYAVLPYFSSDWLNEFWNEREDLTDDYKFVYMGPKGSWTPFHADVFRSYSWSANVCGCKRWILCSPSFSNKILKNFGKMPYDISAVIDLDNECECLEIIQQPGEIIFVPSNWYHQVYNLDDCISINHNWFNASNIDAVWEFLQSSLIEVKKEIADCVEMEGWAQQCQVLLKAVQGIDFMEFCTLLMTIGKNRLRLLENKELNSILHSLPSEEVMLLVEENARNYQTEDKDQSKMKFEIQLIIKDMCKIKELLQVLIKFPDWEELENCNLLDSPEKILQEISEYVSS